MIKLADASITLIVFSFPRSDDTSVAHQGSLMCAPASASFAFLYSSSPLFVVLVVFLVLVFDLILVHVFFLFLTYLLARVLSR